MLLSFSGLSRELPPPFLIDSLEMGINLFFAHTPTTPPPPTPPGLGVVFISEVVSASFLPPPSPHLAER